MKPSLYLQPLYRNFFDLDKPQASPKEFEFFRHYLRKSNRPHLEPNVWNLADILFHTLHSRVILLKALMHHLYVNAYNAKCAQKKTYAARMNNFLKVSQQQSVSTSYFPRLLLSFLDTAHVTMCLPKLLTAWKMAAHFVFDVETVYAVQHKPGLWHGKAYKS